MANLADVVNLSTGISLVSLVVSGSALFYSQLRAPKLLNVIGPAIKLYYPPDGGTGFYLPATFLNEAPSTGTVLRCGITLFRKTSPEERFFMEWRYFARLGPDASKFILEEPAHALAIPGKASIAKILWLTWGASSNPPLQLGEGEYVLVFHYWTTLSGKPHNDSHELYINNKLQSLLDSYRTNRQATTVDLILDKTIESNRLLTSYESKSLLGL